MALAVTADHGRLATRNRRPRLRVARGAENALVVRDGGLAQASSKIVRVALDRSGRALRAAADGTIYALAPRAAALRGEWRCVAQTKTNVPPG